LTVSLTTESPDLKGFDNIENLTLLIADDTTPRFEQFRYIACLKDAEARMVVVGIRTGQLLSLNGLDAPLLEEVRLNGAGLVEIKALSKSPLLENVWICLRIKNYPALRGYQRNSAATLVSLNLQKCESLESIESCW